MFFARLNKSMLHSFKLACVLQAPKNLCSTSPGPPQLSNILSELGHQNWSLIPQAAPPELCRSGYFSLNEAPHLSIAWNEELE